MCFFVCFFVYVRACLQESVEDMGLYEHVSGAGITSVQVTVAPSGLFVNDPC